MPLDQEIYDLEKKYELLCQQPELFFTINLLDWKELFSKLNEARKQIQDIDTKLGSINDLTQREELQKQKREIGQVCHDYIKTCTDYFSNLISQNITPTPLPPPTEQDDLEEIAERYRLKALSIIFDDCFQIPHKLEERDPVTAEILNVKQSRYLHYLHRMAEITTWLKMWAQKLKNTDTLPPEEIKKILWKWFMAYGIDIRNKELNEVATHAQQTINALQAKETRLKRIFELWNHTQKFITKFNSLSETVPGFGLTSTISSTRMHTIFFKAKPEHAHTPSELLSPQRRAIKLLHRFQHKREELKKLERPWKIDDYLQELEDRIIVPHRINQGRYNTCGPASLFMWLAELDPVGYVDFALDLIVNEQTTKRLSAKKPKASSAENIDEIMLIALRHQANALPYMEGKLEPLSGVTKPHEIVGWLRDFFSDAPDLKVINTARLAMSKFKKIIFRIQEDDVKEYDDMNKNFEIACSHSQQGACLIMLANATLFGGKEGNNILGFEIAHYAKIQNLQLNKATNTVSFLVDTYGERKIIEKPYDEFIKHYRGCIIFYPPKQLRPTPDIPAPAPSR